MTQHTWFRVTVRIGADHRIASVFDADQVDGVLREVECVHPPWRLHKRRGDPHAHSLVRDLILASSGAQSGAGYAKAVGKAALWLAMNHPAGSYRGLLAEALRQHGRADLIVQADPSSGTWAFAIADRLVDLSPAINEASQGMAISWRRHERSRGLH